MMIKLSKCPICRYNHFFHIGGFDYKPGPEIYAFLNMPGNISQWNVCKRCAFLFQNPRPDPGAIKALYKSGIYRHKKKYDEVFFKSRYERPLRHFKWLAKLNVDLPNKSVLDIGAGFGGAVRAFTDCGFDATGIEIDVNLRKEAKRRFNVDLRWDDIAGCRFTHNSYGLIYSAHVHEHFDDFHRINKLLFSWLAPGGCLLCILPTYRYSAKNGQGYINVFHNSIFTKTSLKNMFLKCGMEPIAFHYPLEHSLAEVWGVARKPLTGSVDDHMKLIFDNWFYVVQEIRYGPVLFDIFYMVTRPLWLVYYGIRSIIK